MTGIELTRLTAEHLVEPLGLAVDRPRFSWVIDAGEARAVRQLAYELEVYREDEQDPHWSSDRVDSAESVLVDYAGPPLTSATRYTWRVRIWYEAEDRAEEAPTSWATSRFETSLLRPGDWSAGWIEPEQQPVLADGARHFGEIFGYTATSPPEDRLHPAQYLRQTFDLPETPIRGRLYATAHGVYQAELNGQSVGDQVLAPGYFSYDRELAFQTYDVTDQLRPGRNALGVVLGDGWYAGRISITGQSAQYGDRLQASWQLAVRYADGRSEMITSDGAVRSTTGPIRYSDLFVGECHDARLHLGAWSTPEFDDRDWQAVRTVSITAPLVPFVGEPVRRVMELPVATLLRTPAGETVADFGQVIAGRVRLRVSGPAGTTVTLEHSETLDEHGNYFSNIEGPNKDQTDTYILAGHPGGETWQPLFTFHGFRYVRISGWPGELSADSLTAVVIASDLRTTGDFVCSDADLSQLHRNVVWSQRGNFLAVPTDCPQRERAGWTGDIQIFAPTAATNMMVAPFLSRWLDNLRQDQKPDGQVTIMVPQPPAQEAIFASVGPVPEDGSFELDHIQAAAGWGDAVLIVPWVLYQRYGDRRVLEQNYRAMADWVAFQSRSAAARLPARLRGADLSPEQRRRQELLWNGEPNFGDWLTPSTLRSGPGFHEAIKLAPRLTGELVGAMFGGYSLRLISQVASALGYDAEASAYAARADAVDAAFVTEYLSSDGQLPVDLQGVYVLALALGFVPDDRRAAVVDHLVRLVHAADDHLDTGFLSVPYLLDVLWENGERELAWRLLRQHTPPSWLYEVRMGATTIWESWESIAPDGSVGPTSLNHYAFGCVDDWLYRRVAGLQPVTPGYRQSRVEPDLDAGLSWLFAYHDTPYGRLALDWHVEGDQVGLAVTVPANTTAVLKLPDRWTTEAGITGSIPLNSGTTALTAVPVSRDPRSMP